MQCLAFGDLVVIGAFFILRGRCEREVPGNITR